MAIKATKSESGSRPRVLIVHNTYQQRGGEDSVVEAECALLRQAGHEVELYQRNNADVANRGQLQLAADTVWSRRTTSEIDELVERFSPDVIHVHNTLALISPSVYWAAARAGVPVVQTLHNFRLMCPQGMLLREEAVCEDCVGKLPWRAVAHRCYRGSLAASAVVATTLTVHRALGTFQNKVTRFIALNEFCRDKFVSAGLPAQRVRIKPNFIDMPAATSSTDHARSGGLFVGRLTVEKGVRVLLSALRQCESAKMAVVGTGELEGEVGAVSAANWLGFKPLDEILRLMRAASYLVLPSIWFENFPRTIVEAYACSLPVIASRLGALSEIVLEGETGLLFDPNSADDLAQKLRWASSHPDEMLAMGRNARARYERYYTPQANYNLLSEIYAESIESRARHV